jgi:hypothetical protein
MQKDLVEQKKKLDETKAQAAEAVKQHDDLMATLKENQDAAELADVKIVNLKGQIDKQKSFNDDLQAKIDALEAKQAGNDGKAAGGDTPKTEADMKAEQEQKEFDDKKTAFEQELKGRGFGETNNGNYGFMADNLIINAGMSRSSDGPCIISIGSQGVGETGITEKTFTSKTLSGLDKQISNALALIDKRMTVLHEAEGKKQFIAVADSDEVVTMTKEDYESALKKFKMDLVGGPVETNWAWALRNRLEKAGITDPQILMQKFLELQDKAIDDDAKTRIRIGLAYSIEKIPGYESIAALTEIKDKLTNFYDSVEGSIKDIAANGLDKSDNATQIALKEIDNLPDGWKKDQALDNVIAYGGGGETKVSVRIIGGQGEETYTVALWDGNQPIASNTAKTIDEANGYAVEMMKNADALKTAYLEEVKKENQFPNPGELGQQAFKDGADRIPPSGMTIDDMKAWLDGWDKENLATPLPSESVEPAAVSVLNDILAGKYDGDSTKMGDALDNAAADLERDGKSQEYDELLNKAADYLTESLKKEAA